MKHKCPDLKTLRDLGLLAIRVAKDCYRVGGKLRAKDPIEQLVNALYMIQEQYNEDRKAAKRVSRKKRLRQK